MKRGNENSALSKEEFDALEDDDESNDPGTFQRASREEMANRKVFRIAGRKSSGSSKPEESSTSNAMPSSNPFSGFSIPKPAEVGGTQLFTPQVPAKKEESANPFAALQLPKPSAALNFSLPAPPQNQALSQFAPDKKDNKATDKPETEFMKKIKKLNESFLQWSDRQIKEKAVAVWKDGVKDYLKYAKGLKEKYGEEAAEPEADSAPQEISKKIEAPVIKPAFETKSQIPVSNPPAPDAKPFSFTLGGNTSAPLAFAAPPAAPQEKKADPAPFPSSGFSFSFSKPTENATDKPAAAPAPFTFNLSGPAAPPAAPSTTFPSTSFSFTGSLLPKPAESSDNKPAPFSFLSTPASSFAFAPAQNKEADGDDGDGGDDEGEPILEPEKILKNENDTDEILLEVPTKLFGFNQEDKEWKESGKGTLRITKDPATQKRRILVRNTMGKITLNTAFYKEMKIDQVKGGIKFNGVVAQVKDPSKTELKSFMLKLKDSDIARVKSFLEDIIKSL